MDKRRPPAAGMGRKKGQQNKSTRILKDAILLAAEQVGEDGAGRDGLIGYLRMIASSEPKAFSQLLGRVLPLQITGDSAAPLQVQIIRYSDDLLADDDTTAE